MMKLAFSLETETLLGHYIEMDDANSFEDKESLWKVISVKEKLYKSLKKEKVSTYRG